MRQEYKDELRKLATKMNAAEHFAEKLPVFSVEILREKLTENIEWIKFGERYKTMPFPWGINRGLYSQESNRKITNYRKKYHGYLFCLYINTLTLYDRHDKYGLPDIIKADYFFFDALNSTFYATDEQIGLLLESLHEWYLLAMDSAKQDNAKARLEKLKHEIEKAEREALHA